MGHRLRRNRPRRVRSPGGCRRLSRNVERSWNSYDEFAAGMARLEVAQRFGGLTHGILAIDNRSQLALLHQIAQNGQVCFESLRDVHLELLGNEWRHDEGFQIASYPRQLAFV